MRSMKAWWCFRRCLCCELRDPWQSFSCSRPRCSTLSIMQGLYSWVTSLGKTHSKLRCNLVVVTQMLPRGTRPTCSQTCVCEVPNITLNSEPDNFVPTSLTGKLPRGTRLSPESFWKNTRIKQKVKVVLVSKGHWVVELSWRGNRM